VAKVPNGIETAENFNPLSRTYERYRRHTSGFTFAKKCRLYSPSVSHSHGPRQSGL